MSRSRRGSTANGSLQPAPRASYAGSLAPPQNYQQPLQGSSFFQPQPPPSSHGPSGPGSAVMPISRPGSRMEPPPLSATAGPMPGTLERPIHGPKKRLIVTCDGTWLDSDNGLMNGMQQPPSNVSRIGWAIKETSRDGIPQVVHYQAGVGSKGGRLSKIVGGATGAGLKENVREAYSFIAINWCEGDEIFLLGFSRGAFTARSVAGLIGETGLLTRKGMPFFSEIFEDVEHKHDDRYVSKYPDQPFRGKGPFNNEYKRQLSQQNLTRMNVPICAVGVWDTVGALGVPRVPLLESLGIQSRQMRDYSFYDTRLNPCIQNAFQALALDEHRAPFSPALWELHDNTQTTLKQVWFPGVHSNIGGGYDDQDLSNITLAWMMGKLEPWIDFHSDFIMSGYETNRTYYKTTNQRVRWWSFGEIHNSLKGLYSLTGSRTRTPGNYYRTDPATGRTTSKRLRSTHEYIHPSVRSRVGLQGPGYMDQGVYEPRALAQWTFASEDDGTGSGGVRIIWTDRSAGDYHKKDDGDRARGQRRIPECPLSETEMRLLEMSPRVADYIKDVRPVPGEKQKKRRSRRV